MQLWSLYICATCHIRDGRTDEDEDAALVVVHLRHLRRVGRVLGALVVAHAEEAREAEGDALGGIDMADGGEVRR